jgi:hypothetical protein
VEWKAALGYRYHVTPMTWHLVFLVRSQLECHACPVVSRPDALVLPLGEQLMAVGIGNMEEVLAPFGWDARAV